MTVDYDDLRLAFEFVSSSAPTENQVFVSLDTGQTFWISNGEPVDDAEIPDDVEESDRYVAVPHKHDLDLGRELVFRYAAQHLPHRLDEILDLFHARGAYRRFRALLEAENRLQQWQAFEEEATRRALQEWCDDNGLQLVNIPPAS
jgi:hypothetical protein